MTLRRQKYRRKPGWFMTVVRGASPPLMPPGSGKIIAVVPHGSTHDGNTGQRGIFLALASVRYDVLRPGSYHDAVGPDADRDPDPPPQHRICTVSTLPNPVPLRVLMLLPP